MTISRFLLAASVLGFAAIGQSQVLNLWWEPSTQNATLGSTVTVSVYANSSGPTTLDLSDAYLAITWDPAKLLNTTPATVTEPAPWASSYWAPGAPINSSVLDGDAQRELLGQLPPAFPVAPVGSMHDPLNRLKVTSFSFKVLDTSQTSVKLWSSVSGATTNFYKGNFQIGQWNLAFDQGSYSEATINAVPEPLSLAAIGTGLLLLRRRRRR